MLTVQLFITCTEICFVGRGKTHFNGLHVSKENLWPSHINTLSALKKCYHIFFIYFSACYLLTVEHVSICQKTIYKYYYFKILETKEHQKKNGDKNSSTTWARHSCERRGRSLHEAKSDSHTHSHMVWFCLTH